MGVGNGSEEVDLPGRTVTVAFLISFAFTSLLPFLIFNPPDLHAAYLTSEVATNQQLSLQTWFIHTSSLLEWLLAMKLIWTKSPRMVWEGKVTRAHAPIVYAMVPLHASGVTACVYHLFSNDVPYLVAVQAGLTTFGNVCLWLATRQTRERLDGWSGEEVKGEEVKKGEELQDILSVVFGTLASGFIAKQISDNYMVPAFDLLGVDGCGAVALIMIGVAAALNYQKWSDRESQLT